MSSASGYPAPGARIGRFRILEQLGRGGMGVVFRAMEENLGRQVALKVIAPHYAHDPEFRRRFIREAQAQASLESAHVVAVYAHGEEDGYLYIASQLVADGDLGRLIRTVGVPPMVDALAVIEQVASGLSDAHEAGLVHRDIKPGNVLVRLRGGTVRAYLADFGIARRTDADATRAGHAPAGTPLYMAPEIHNGAPASFATDIYSLGCVLWAALTGSAPYTGATDYQVIGAHLSQPVPQLPGTAAMVQATNRILRLAMAKDPRERYPTAAAMRADLQSALRLPSVVGAAPLAGGAAAGAGAGALPPHTPATPSRVATAPGPGPSYDAPRRTGRGRRFWIGLAAAAAVLALGGGVAAALLLDDGGGGDDPREEFLALSAKDMLLAMEKEMSVLQTVRVRGSFDDGTEDIEVDVVATSNGECEGTIGYATGGTAELLRVDEKVYVKPTEEFLTHGGNAAGAVLKEHLGDRWLLFPDDGGTWEDICDLDRLLERDGREDANAEVEATDGQVDGEDVVQVHQWEGTSSEQLYIRIAEPHYLLRIDEDSDASFTYSDFDAEAQIEPPADGEWVNEKQLVEEATGGGAG